MGKEWGLLPRLKTLGLLLAAIGFACPAYASNATGGGQVLIVTPLSLVNTDSLRFGSIIPSATAGTVTINPFTEARTSTGGVTLVGATFSAAKFAGLSSNPSHLKIDVPNGLITLTHTNGVNTMTVGSFTLNGNKNDWVTSNEVFVFNVGGRLNVGANQVAGTYTGTFNVTVNYR